MIEECVHETTVEQLLNVIAAAGTSTPSEIRDAVAACEALLQQNVAGLLGAQTIDVELTPPPNDSIVVYELRSRPVIRRRRNEDDDGIDDDAATVAADAVVTDELLRALRLVFANPTLRHDRAKPHRWWSHWRCKVRRMESVVTVRISERYCHRTLYWLCEILALACVKFTVRLRTPRSRSMTEARSLLLSAMPDTDIAKVDARLTLFREELANLRAGISRDCRYCVRTMLNKLSVSVGNITREKDIATIPVTSEFVRLYRKVRATDQKRRLWPLCNRHEGWNNKEDVEKDRSYRCCEFPYIIDLVLDLPADRYTSTRPRYTCYAPYRHSATSTTIGHSSVRAVANLMRDIAVFAPMCTRDQNTGAVTDYGTLCCSMPGFEIFHRLFSLLPLLGEQSFLVTLTHNSYEAILAEVYEEERLEGKR